jgi:hypothetical protein
VHACMHACVNRELQYGWVPLRACMDGHAGFTPIPAHRHTYFRGKGLWYTPPVTPLPRPHAHVRAFHNQAKDAHVTHACSQHVRHACNA